MSVIAALYRPEGAPVSERELSALLAPVADRTPDGVEHRLLGKVGLSFGALHTTPEARLESQPLRCASGERVLCFAGRLDNRGDLQNMLRARGMPPRDETDAELVLCSYLVLGSTFVEHLLGDFTLVLWDRSTQTLLCARDPMGQRPLFYSYRAGTFACASEIAQLLSHPTVSLEPNESVVAQYLARCVVSETETLYRDVTRLLPGQLLSVTRTGLTVRTFARLEDAPDVRYQDEREYGEHFRSLLDQAIRCRLRSDRPIGVQVSGGLDSSSVFVSTLAVLGPEGASQLRPYTLTFPDQPTCDEVRYVEAIERMTGQAIKRFQPNEHALASLGTAARTRELPENSIARMYREPNRYLRGEGVRTVLTGDGGDEWFSGNRRQYADLLREGKLRALVQQIMDDRRAFGSDANWLDVPRYALWPFVPPQLKDQVRRARGRELVQPHLHPDLIRRTGLRQLTQEGPRRCPSFEHDMTLSRVQNGWAYRATDASDATLARQHLETRAPLMDLRLARFGLGLPRDQRWRGLDTKLVLRRGPGTRLPAIVRERRDKAEFSHVVLGDLHTRQRALEGFPALCARGWVDGTRSMDLLREFLKLYAARDPRYFGKVWTVWMLLALEEWARGLDEAAQGRERRNDARTATTSNQA